MLINSMCMEYGVYNKANGCIYITPSPGDDVDNDMCYIYATNIYIYKCMYVPHTEHIPIQIPSLHMWSTYKYISSHQLATALKLPSPYIWHCHDAGSLAEMHVSML